MERDMKYIIEIAKEYEEYFKGILICGIADGKFAVDVIAREDLEELTSDYINEHFSELQDMAYQRGYKACMSENDFDSPCTSCEAYQRGLNGAWEAARKLFSSMADSDIEKAFPIEWNNGGFNALMNLQPQEAIEKLKAYEEKQADKITAGDEVVSKYSGIKGVLLEPETEDVLATIIVPSQRWRTIYDSHQNLEKTGKHYDIEKFLEAMKA